MTAAPNSRLVNRVAEALRAAIVTNTIRGDSAEDHQAWLRHLATATLASCQVEELEAVLRDLLEDTQHSGHECGDVPENCPVLRARYALAKLGSQP